MEKDDGGLAVFYECTPASVYSGVTISKSSMAGCPSQ
jgi:hypothetical protein